MDTLRRRSTGDTTISPATRDSALPWQRNIAKARELVKLAETSVSSIDGDQLDDSGELTNTPTKEDNGDAIIAKWEANVAEFCGPSEGIPRSAVLVELEPQRDEMRASADGAHYPDSLLRAGRSAAAVPRAGGDTRYCVHGITCVAADGDTWEVAKQ